MIKNIATALIVITALAMTSQKRKQVLFFGDSITQMGTNKGGYVKLVDSMLKQRNQQDSYAVSASGVGYNKIYDLYLRMDEDVLAVKPDVVVVYIGVNDVGHKYSTRTGTDIDKFEVFYLAIIKKLQANGIEVVLATPTLIGEKKDGTNAQDAELDAYSDVARKLAGNFKLKLVDLRTAFINYEKTYNTANQESGLLTVDRIHPTAIGNLLLAEEMMKVLMPKQ